MISISKHFQGEEIGKQRLKAIISHIVPNVSKITKNLSTILQNLHKFALDNTFSVSVKFVTKSKS